MKQKLEVAYVLDNLNMWTELKKTLLGVILKPESSTASRKHVGPGYLFTCRREDSTVPSPGLV